MVAYKPYGNTVRKRLYGHPQIMEAYMKQQELMGKPRNLNVAYDAGTRSGGFLWSDAVFDRWSCVLEKGDFEAFYKVHPKSMLQAPEELDDILASLEVKTLAIN